MASISRLPSGNWQVRWRSPDRHNHKKTFHRKKDAERYARDIETTIDHGTFIDPRNRKTPFNDFAQQWLDTRTVKPKTMSGYRSILANHLIPAFGDTPLGNIDAVNVQTWIAQLQRSGLSPSRIRQCHSALHSILDLAVRSRYIAANPAHKAQLPKIPPREPRYLNSQQVADLAAAVDPRYETLIYTLAYAGLRWGEAVGLKFDRVDLSRNRLIIGETLSEVDGKLYTVAPKTHRRREVVIPPFLHTMLVNHLRDVDELVWTTPSGKPLRSSNFRKKVWIPALETAGIEYLRVHDLRHTAASLMISAGASPKAIAGQLGHNSIKVTMDTYGHLFPSDQDALAAALDRQWKAAQEASGEGVAPLTRPASDSNVVPIGRG